MYGLINSQKATFSVLSLISRVHLLVFLINYCMYRHFSKLSHFCFKKIQNTFFKITLSCLRILFKIRLFKKRCHILLFGLNVSLNMSEYIILKSPLICHFHHKEFWNQKSYSSNCHDGKGHKKHVLTN